MAIKNKLDVILEVMDAATTLGDLQGIVEKIGATMAIDHKISHWVDRAGDHYYFGTYSAEWAARYQEMNYVRIDPVVASCYRGVDPVNWKELDWTPKNVRGFLADALEHGVGNQGYSIPMRGPNGQFAVFTVSHNCSDADWDRFISDHGRSLVLMAFFFNSKALQLEPQRTGKAQKTLSPREVDVLTLLGIGKSRAQVSEALSISQHTLRVYVESARAKLAAENTTHAVAVAISRGLVII